MSDMPLRVVEAAVSQLGSPYVFGAWGALCTPAERRKRYGLHSEHTAIISKCQVLRSNNPKPNCDGCQWQGDRCFDCRGFTDWCLKQVGIDLYGDGATTQYKTKGNWLERGEIADMPECVCCVFIQRDGKMSHTGLYIGGGETIECGNGVQRKPLDKRWTHYGIPAGLYTAEEIADIRGGQVKPLPTLRKGDRGADVKRLQEMLNSRGYDCGTADGIFGKRTLAAVTLFQIDNGLSDDGIVGTKTWAVLNGEQPTIKTYTIKIPGLTLAQVEELRAQFPGAELI